MRSAQTSLLFLAIASTAAGAAAQSWTLLNPAPYPSSTQRRTGGIAYDLIQNKLLMYGGYEGGIQQDTWTFDGAVWTPITPATTPPPRWGHKMVFDSQRAKIVTFGGRSPGVTTNANDTWEWDGFDWQQVVTANAPSTRAFYGMAFDDHRGKTVLYGGGLGGTIFPGDYMWEYDGSDWTQVTTATTLPGLESPAMAYDKGRGVTVMFGGWNGSTATDYRNTWEYDGVDWVDRGVLPGSPQTGYRTGMVYDDARGRLVLYGGYSGGALTDVYEYDGNAWTLVLAGSAPANAPGWISEGFMAYYPGIAQTVYFGGSGPPTGAAQNETWLYAGPSTAIAAPFGQGCPTSAGVPTLTPSTLPQLGSQYTMMADNGAFAGLGVIVHGFSNMHSAFGPLPFDLSVVGLNGCSLLVSQLGSEFIPIGPGVGTVNLTFPNAAYLLNQPLFSQLGVLDSQASNGVGGVSNAVHAVLGT